MLRVKMAWCAAKSTFFNVNVTKVFSTKLTPLTVKKDYLYLFSVDLYNRFSTLADLANDTQVSNFNHLTERLIWPLVKLLKNIKVKNHAR